MRGHWTWVLRGFVVAAMLAAPAAAPAAGPSIAAFVPADVGADDVFAVEGAGLALPGLSAALLVPVRAGDGTVLRFDARPLAIVSVADDRLELRVRTARPGDAFLRLAGTRGAGVTVSRLTLGVHGPELAREAPVQAAPRASFTVTGSWLGERGTLRVGQVRAHVRSWDDDTIVATVPTSLPEGVHGVEVRNAVGRTIATGVLDVRGGAPPARGAVVVRERAASRVREMSSTTFNAASGDLEIYASRSGPVEHHSRDWEVCWIDNWLFSLCQHYHTEWTRQRVDDLQLSASGLAFDASGAAVATGCTLEEGWHIHHSRRGDVSGRRFASVTDLVVVVHRAQDGTVSGSFSGLRKGHLVEGRFGMP